MRTTQQPLLYLRQYLNRERIAASGAGPAADPNVEVVAVAAAPETVVVAAAPTTVNANQTIDSAIEFTEFPRALHGADDEKTINKLRTTQAYKCYARLCVFLNLKIGEATIKSWRH